MSIPKKYFLPRAVPEHCSERRTRLADFLSFMQLILTIPWYFFDAHQPGLPRVRIEPGQYPVEMIPNPLGVSDQPWIVLAGTAIGMNASSMRMMHGDAWGDFSLQLVESQPKPEPAG